MSKSNRLNGMMIALVAALATQATVAQEVAAIDPSGEAINVPAASDTSKTSDATDDSNAGKPVEPDGAESSPTATIETFHRGLLEIMKQAKTLGFQGRIDELTPLMAQTFDLDFMASKSLGRTWRTFSDEKKRLWAETFTRFTVANYAGRFTGFTGEEFVTLGVEDAARGTRIVLTKIVIPSEDDVQLNYRVIQKDGEWQVIDVYLDGTVSELALRRSEYSSALKREGFEQLLASIEIKIEDLKTKGLAEG